MTTRTAAGDFDVKMLPPASGAGATGDGFLRLSMEKTFRGALDDGKAGGFILQHSGIMAPGMMEIRVVVSPGSGTGDLAGIEGTLDIRLEGKKHFYTLTYKLPTPSPNQ